MRHRFETALVEDSQRKTPPSEEDNVQFGSVPTDHMVICDFLAHEGGWQTPKIVPFHPFTLSPDSLVFHYGQQIFEGMKAYRSTKDQKTLFLFRPEQNAERFANSAKLLGMEPVPVDLFLESVKELTKVESKWILPAPWSLYIRPTLIPLDTGVSVRPSKNYRFFVITFPVQEYFTAENGVTVYIEKNRVRAAVGGVGEAKCGGNYAASLSAQMTAKERGAQQVLWLDAKEHKYIEEVGAMNVAFIYDKKIVTPKLSGSILKGVTRSCVIQVAKDMGLEVEEKRISIEQVTKDIASGKLREAFGCGTAAIISPIRALVDDNKSYELNRQHLGKTSLEIRSKIVGIQTDETKDPYGWRIALD